MKKNKQKQAINSKEQQFKKQYVKPALTSLGDIRDVTMGGSPGFGDSGAGAPEEPF
jgi:hypothetical protein